MPVRLFICKECQRRTTLFKRTPEKDNKKADDKYYRNFFFLPCQQRSVGKNDGRDDHDAGREQIEKVIEFGVKPKKPDHHGSQQNQARNDQKGGAESLRAVFWYKAQDFLIGI